MRFLLLCVFLLTGCQLDLADYSNEKIQYQVISLSNSKRRPLVELQFDAINQAINIQNTFPNIATQSNVTWGYFDALGPNLDLNQLIQEGYFTGNLKRGELGLLKTTTDLVMPAAMLLPDKNMMVIFEDDVVLPINLDATFRIALKNTPTDWDLLFLGCYEESLSGEGRPICPSSGLSKIQGSTWRKIDVTCLTGTFAYALNSSSARKINSLLNHQKPFNKPIDILYQEFFGNGEVNAYCIGPELVHLNEILPSTINAK